MCSRDTVRYMTPNDTCAMDIVHHLENVVGNNWNDDFWAGTTSELGGIIRGLHRRPLRTSSRPVARQVTPWSRRSMLMRLEASGCSRWTSASTCMDSSHAPRGLVFQLMDYSSQVFPVDLVHQHNQWLGYSGHRYPGKSCCVFLGKALL